MFAVNTWPTTARHSEGESLRRFKPQLERARSIFQSAFALTNDQLHARGERLREQVLERPLRPMIASEAVGVAAEAVRRIWGLSAYDEQILAALILADGNLAEMAAGEGKTLVAALVAFVFGLQGRGVHVATVNGYLAKRDFDFVQPVFEMLATRVGCLPESGTQAEKLAAYACDVTYGVGTEFGFDYLRDQLALRSASSGSNGTINSPFHKILLGQAKVRPEILQRDHAFAIIDEADSVLIDEARSPLIISTGPRRPCATPEVYLCADRIAKNLAIGSDYSEDQQSGRYELTEQGIALALQTLPSELVPQLRRLWPHYIEQSLYVLHRLRRDVDYAIIDGQITIIDEFTGRLCPDRTWRDGLHQAVEASANVEITQENNSEATITRPAYFRLYDTVCGMTGTAREAAGELRRQYRMVTWIVPLHRPSCQLVLRDRIFRDRQAKISAVIDEILRHAAAGQPVLVGTRTLENSEQLAARLEPTGLKFRVLNAKNEAEEARLIEQAGQPGAITIATNMAGRGAHIPVPETAQRAGGLHVIGFERHAAARIDRQLVGRSARQGQPGSVQFFLSLEDDLIVRHAPEAVKNLAARYRRSELPSHAALRFRQAQRKAEATEYRGRRALAVYDEWLDELKTAM
jgi:preprotein translocase subunit SecA